MIREEMSCSEQGKGRSREGFSSWEEAGEWKTWEGQDQSWGGEEWWMSRESSTRLCYVVWKRTRFCVSLGTCRGQGGAQVTCVTSTMLNTQKNGRRETIQSRDRDTPMGISVKGDGKKGETLETKNRCENCWDIQF